MNIPIKGYYEQDTSNPPNKSERRQSLHQQHLTQQPTNNEKENIQVYNLKKANSKFRSLEDSYNFGRQQGLTHKDANSHKVNDAYTPTGVTVHLDNNNQNEKMVLVPQSLLSSLFASAKLQTCRSNNGDQATQTNIDAFQENESQDQDFILLKNIMPELETEKDKPTEETLSPNKSKIIETYTDRQGQSIMPDSDTCHDKNNISPLKIQATREFNFFRRKKSINVKKLDILGLTAKRNKFRDPIKPDAPLKLTWDAAVMLIMIIDFVILPMQISFGMFHNIVPFGYISTSVLLLDVAINFHTSYYHHGLRIMKHHKIARNYMQTWFIPDLIVSFPFWAIGSINEEETFQADNPYILLQLIRIIKIFKLLRLLQAFKLSLFLKRYKLSSVNAQYLDGFLRLWNLFFLSTFLVHWVGCIWHYIAILEIEISGETTWLHEKGIENAPPSVRYIHSLYWAITTLMTVGYGDITAVTVTELWFSAFSMLLGCGVFAYIISSIGSIVLEMRKEKAEVNSRIYKVDRFLHENKITKKTQSNVKTYMRFMYEDEYNRKNSQRDILAEMPTILRKDLLVDLNMNMLNSNMIFVSNFGSEFLQELCLHLQERIVEPQELVDTGRRKREEDTFFYFVGKGRIELMLKGTRKPLKTLTLGKYFGDVAFFSDRETKIEARSVTYSRIYYLSKKAFLRVLAKYPREKESYCLIRDKINLYNDYSNLYVKCFVCGQEDHIVSSCPELSLVIRSDEILSITKSEEINVRKAFRRRMERNHFKIFPSNPVHQDISDKGAICGNDGFPNELNEDVVFDKAKVFEKYFPHNNIDNVLQLLNSPSKWNTSEKSGKADIRQIAKKSKWNMYPKKGILSSLLQYSRRKEQSYKSDS